MFDCSEIGSTVPGFPDDMHLPALAEAHGLVTQMMLLHVAHLNLGFGSKIRDKEPHCYRRWPCRRRAVVPLRMAHTVGGPFIMSNLLISSMSLSIQIGLPRRISRDDSCKSSWYVY
jgi:hypothetical protein